MSQNNDEFRLPDYDEFIESISALPLLESASTLHGKMCGFLCAGANSQGEAYLRALSNNNNGEAARALFSVFTISQQHIAHFDFEFALLVPDDTYPLAEQAQALSEWCEGFLEGLSATGVDAEQFYEEDAQEALAHLREFTALDFENCDLDEDEENALMEIYEFTRMAVLRLRADLVANEEECAELIN